MIRVLLVALLLSLVSCKNNDTASEKGVYFAGEIVNPTSDYVVLYRKDKVVDSAKLDENNHFVFNLKNVEEGLHHFDHSPELQYVFFEKGDSILIRLNTVAFDESLVFSGTNGDVNNFLIEMFLNNEDEEQYVYTLYKLPPEEFSLKIDSLRNQKLDVLNDIQEHGNLSENGLAMAQASIDYSSFMYREKYPFYHKKYTGEETIHDLDPKFYAHRVTNPSNFEELVYFRPYYDYMKYHFGNLSYMVCAEKCQDLENDRKSYLHLNKHKVKLIDSLITNEELRNNLFRSVVMDVLLKEHQATDECDAFIEKFESLSTNKSHHQEIENLYQGIKNLQSNLPVPELDLVATNDEKVSLKEIAKGEETVIYFWSAAQKRHFKNVTQRVEQLQEKYPDKKFVGICVMTPKNVWKSMLGENDFKNKNQFWAQETDEVRNTLIVDGLNKCVIVNDSLIENGFGNLYRSL